MQIYLSSFFSNPQKKSRELHYRFVTLRSICHLEITVLMKEFIDHCHLYKHVGIFSTFFGRGRLHQILFMQFDR